MSDSGDRVVLRKWGVLSSEYFIVVIRSEKFEALEGEQIFCQITLFLPMNPKSLSFFIHTDFNYGQGKKTWRLGVAYFNA